MYKYQRSQRHFAAEILKYDMFPAANLGQEYSKQIFFFFLSIHGLGCSENTDAWEQKSLSGDLSCLASACREGFLMTFTLG